MFSKFSLVAIIAIILGIVLFLLLIFALAYRKHD